MRVFTCGRIIINYISIGHGAKTIIFLHGWAGSTSSFLRLATALSDKYRCILVDFAGFGATPEPNQPYKLRDYTNDLDALLIDLNIKECFFVAHSFGGRVAIDYASQEVHSQIKGMVLISSAGIKPRRGMKYYYKVSNYKIRKKLGLNTANYGSDDYRALSPVMKGTFVNIVNEYSNKKLHNIHTATLIINGDKDNETPLYMAKKLNRGIKESALIVLKGRGHFVYLEEEYKCYKIIDSFLEGIN